MKLLTKTVANRVGGIAAQFTPKPEEAVTKPGRIGPKPSKPAKAPPVTTAKEITPIKPKFDRTAYQRELMRKRRAKQKEAGE